MKVLLLKDVYKLGRAGDVKKVANGFGRNFLIPQGLAVLATPGSLKQVDHIRAKADAIRVALNNEMAGVAEKLSDLVLTFPAKAGETGKLYGSITSQMIVDAIKQKLDVEIDRRSVESEPLRTLGEHSVAVRLTMDLNPKVKVIVHREGESAVAPQETPVQEVMEEKIPAAVIEEALENTGEVILEEYEED